MGASGSVSPGCGLIVRIRVSAGANGCVLRGTQQNKADFTRNLENVVPLLSFANDDVKVPSHRVTAASLSRAEHPYELCNRPCSRQRDVVDGIPSRGGHVRVSSQEAFVEGQEFTVVKHDAAPDHH